MLNKKKKIEYSYIGKFLALLGKVPNEIICGESPDFMCIFQRKTIGVEVTEFHFDSKDKKGSRRRAIEENWMFLQRMIMEKVEKCNELRDTNGLLFFKKEELPPKRRYEKFTDELVKLSREMINSDCEETRLGNNYSLLNEYLKKFRLEKCGCYIIWHWNYNVSFIGLTETALINTVESKIKEVTKYKEKDMDELWLLIVSGYRLSQALGIRLSDKLNTFARLNNLLSKSGYDKVYLYQYMFDVIYEWPGWVKIGRGNFA